MIKKNGQVLQVFPLEKNTKILAAGIHNVINYDVIHALEDTTIDIDFNGGSTLVGLTVKAGERFGLGSSVTKINVIAGTLLIS